MVSSWSRSTASSGRSAFGSVRSLNFSAIQAGWAAGESVRAWATSLGPGRPGAGGVAEAVGLELAHPLQAGPLLGRDGRLVGLVAGREGDGGNRPEGRC